MRAPFQVLIIPFIKKDGEYYYAIFKRQDLDLWQGLAGGGEDDELPEAAAKREAKEEAGLDGQANFIRLASTTSIPAVNVGGLKWGKIFVIPEIAFGVEVSDTKFNLSHEHLEYAWLTAQEAIARLKYDSNKSAVWELDYRLRNNLVDIDECVKNSQKYLFK